METYISTMAYDDEFKSHIRKCGWGCGYVHIPKDHPILVQLVTDDFWENYLSLKDCPEDISFSSWDKDNEYFIIGFDTAHIHNNDSHDEAYVTSQANLIKEIVDTYTADYADNYARNAIDEVKRKFNKYLL